MSDNGKQTIPNNRTIESTGERVAIVETKLAAVKEDTATLRKSMHDVFGEMQKFVAAETKCADHLAEIKNSLKDLPALASAVSAFTEMRPDLRTLVAEREQRLGIAAWGRRFGMIVAAAAALVAAVGGIAGGLVWLAQHLKPLG